MANTKRAKGAAPARARKPKTSVKTSEVTRFIALVEKERRARREVDEFLLDAAEARLLKLISTGSPVAIAFYLKTFGRSRGYGQPRRLEPSDIAKMSDAELERVVDGDLR